MRSTRLVLALAFICAGTAVMAQTRDLRAVAEDGRKVILAPDGRWRFDSSTTSTAPTSPDIGLYQSAAKKFSVSYSPADWALVPRRDTDETNKRTFQHKTLPIYALVVSDEIPATLPTMKDLIIGNARNAGAATTVLLDETQQVSGKDVGAIRFSALIKGLEFMFSAYYYADGDGNIQVTCYTAQSLFFKYQRECQKFLNGLTIK